MNTIQELKDRRDTLTLEMESIQRDLAPFEEALESAEVVQQGRQRAVQDEINDHKRRIDSRDHEIYRLNQKIDRLEALANRESLAASWRPNPNLSRSSLRKTGCFGHTYWPNHE